MSNLDEIVAAVSRSKKYRALCVDTIRRVAERELANHRDPRVALKATKRRLHQVYAAFEETVDYAALCRQLEAAYRGGSGADVKTVCRQILGLHSSTRERLSILPDFYPALWAITGKPGRLLDLGCGLNPLSLPWMDLAPGTQIVALDIDADRIGFLNRFLVLAGLEPLARCQDVLAQPPEERVDVALLLKLSPSLERQEAGATARILDALRARFVVVSFAVRSLGGRDRGMLENYRQQFIEITRNRPVSLATVKYDHELTFIITKQQ